MATYRDRSVMIVDQFAPECAELRSHFDKRFADPRVADGGRFVWDLWNVPGQYTALRTPAWMYFPKKTYTALHKKLVLWGREHLGCHDISPPWMSCYVNGCSQQLHGDLPHGPWAFVLSLTPWKTRNFQGGETLMLRDEVLDFWSAFTSIRSIEEPDVLRTIEPEFARLTVFDPRIPHGVREVRGSMDPREGRLVIHGWFVQPRPYIAGPVNDRALQSNMQALEKVIHEQLSAGLSVAGLLSVRVEVKASGELQAVKLLSDTTRTVRTEEEARVAFVRKVVTAIRRWKFPKQKAEAKLTIPFVFEQS